MASAKRRNRRRPDECTDTDEPRDGGVTTPLRRRRVTGGRLWLFRVIAMVLIPALLVIATEFSLWATGFGYPTQAIVTREVNGRLIHCDSPDFPRRFFPPQLRPDLRPFAFPAIKAPDTYRVFVLGASAALGTPDYAYGFGRILQRMLDAAYPEANIEVITVAMTAINSHVVLPIAQECTRYQPDLIVVYLGNNEVVGPYGPGTVLSPLPPNPLAIRGRIALSATRIGQLIARMGQSLAPRAEESTVHPAMTLFLENQVRADSRALDSVYEHYTSNLADICDAGVASGASVILCTVASNLRHCSPFSSLHRPGLLDAEKKLWDVAYAEGAKYEGEGKYELAVERYLAAVEIDETFADLQFRLGGCYWAVGEHEQARERYIAARDLDTLRFRADTHINEAIRSVARDKAGAGVILADVDAAVAEQSPYQVPGEELFFEHVHFTFKGNYILARAVFRQIEASATKSLLGPRSAHELLTEEECADLLAYTGWDRWRIISLVLQVYISGPPFTNQLYHDEQVKRLKEQLRGLESFTRPAALADATAQYRAAIQQYPKDWNMRWKFSDFLARGLNNNSEAMVQLEKATEHYPYYRVCNQLGSIYQKLGKLDKADDTFRRSLGMTSSADAHFGLAGVFRARQNLEGAIEQLYKALEIPSSRSAAAYMALFYVLRDAGETGKAINALRDGIEILPDTQTPSFHYQLGVFLDQQGRTSEAIVELREALRLLADANNPEHARVRQKLDQLMQKKPVP